MNLLLRWGLNGLALYLTSLLNVGLSFTEVTLGNVLVAALVLGFGQRRGAPHYGLFNAAPHRADTGPISARG